MKTFFKRFCISFTLTVFSVTGFVLFHYNDVAEEPADCAVVFGAAVWKEDIPSHALYDRIVTGIKLYQKGKVNCLVLSGGDSKYGSHEVDVMKKLMGEVDIPVDRLQLDYEGANTQKTIENLDKNKSYIFVSNDFHLARISLFAWRYGIRSFQLQHATYHYGRYTKEPYFFLREVVGIFWYFKWELMGVFSFFFALLFTKKFFYD